MLFGFITKNEINDQKRRNQISKISNEKSCIERFRIISKTSFDQELTKTKKTNKRKRIQNDLKKSMYKRWTAKKKTKIKTNVIILKIICEKLKIKWIHNVEKYDEILLKWFDEIFLNKKMMWYFWWNLFKKKNLEIFRSYFMHCQHNDENTFYFTTIQFLKLWIIWLIDNNTFVKTIKTRLCKLKTLQTNIE